MNVYVFTEVLCDYTPGMAVIAAETLEQAQQIAFSEFNCGIVANFEQFLLESGFGEPAGVYQTADSACAGVLHHVYGGG